jgi:glycosyltransferase involved in cell wall biosynthesis
MEENKKMKVLLVSPYSKKKVGGIGTWSKLIIDYCINNKKVDLVYQNTSFFLRGNLHKNMVHRISIGIVDTIVILVKLFFNLLLHRPDTVHYTSSASFALYRDKIATFIARKIFKKKFIIHWRFGRIPELCALKNKEYYLLLNVLNVVSESIVIDIKSYNTLKRIGMHNVVFIPNPISDQLKHISEQLDINRLHEKRLSGVVVFAGHILKSKGVFELVNVCSKMNNVKRLILIGPCLPSIKDELLTIAKQREDGRWLEFTGKLYRENVYEYYQTCSVFALPSHTEGFPNAVLEAMANACPIVATKVGAIPEMLSDNCGICIDVKDESQLQDSINILLSDNNLAVEMGNNARQKVLSNYSLDKVFNQYLNIWKH